MVIQTKTKFAAITAEGKILNYRSNIDMFAKKETAERNLKKWIEEIRFHEKNSRAYGLNHPEYADLCARDAESQKQLAEMLEACKIVEIKITLERVA